MKSFFSFLIFIFLMGSLALFAPIAIIPYLSLGGIYHWLVAPTWLFQINGSSMGVFQFMGFYFIQVLWLEFLIRCVLILLLYQHYAHNKPKKYIYFIGVFEPLIIYVRGLFAPPPFTWWMCYPIPIFPLIIISLITVPFLRKRLEAIILPYLDRTCQEMTDLEHKYPQNLLSIHDITLVMTILLLIAPATLIYIPAFPYPPTIVILAFTWWIRNFYLWFNPYLPVSYLFLIPLHLLRILFVWQVIRYYQQKTTKLNVQRIGAFNIVLVLLLNAPSHIFGLNSFIFQPNIYFFPLPILILSALVLIEKYPRSNHPNSH